MMLLIMLIQGNKSTHSDIYYSNHSERSWEGNGRYCHSVWTIKSPWRSWGSLYKHFEFARMVLLRECLVRVRVMPRFLGNVMAKIVTAIGPKGINFVIYSIDFHLLRNHLHVIVKMGWRASRIFHAAVCKGYRSSWCILPITRPSESWRNECSDALLIHIINA